jgi:trehalose utilization protein
LLESKKPMSSQTIRVTIWNEFIHEREHASVAKIYPQGIHHTVASALQKHLPGEVAIRTATLDEPEHGLTEEVLAQTDVLTWWGHAAHDRVADEIVDRVQKRVLEGMGLLAMHSAHASKIFRRLMGTSCMLRWREAAEKERVWNLNPSHPITAGLTEEYFELEHTEMYGEFFDIPPPEELLFVSWFEGGEVFRSGCTFRRGKGKIFYFSPGHETFPIYHDRHVQLILANAVRWLAPTGAPYQGNGRNIPRPLSPIASEHIVDESLHRPK